MMESVLCHVPEVNILESLFGQSSDLHLVWPKAIKPFARSQWAEMFSNHKDNISILFKLGDKWIGHAAVLRKESDESWLSFVFLDHEFRGMGRAEKIVAAAEKIAIEHHKAGCLKLIVRDYNHRAYKLYCRVGYCETYRDGSAIFMEKKLSIDS